MFLFLLNTNAIPPNNYSALTHTYRRSKGKVSLCGCGLHLLSSFLYQSQQLLSSLMPASVEGKMVQGIKERLEVRVRKKNNNINLNKKYPLLFLTALLSVTSLPWSRKGERAYEMRFNKNKNKDCESTTFANTYRPMPPFALDWSFPFALDWSKARGPMPQAEAKAREAEATTAKNPSLCLLNATKGQRVWV